jgi:hypothetical protein
MAGASIIAGLIASPRLYTFVENSRGLGRSSNFITTCPCELLRWFNDGIFGRFPEEVARVGNTLYNVHEGFQVYTSTFAALLILVALCMPSLWLRSTSTEAPFHVLMLMSVFLVVLVEPVRYIVYLLFMRTDLLHSRYSSAGLIPAAVLVAVFTDHLIKQVRSRPTGRSLVLTLIAAVAVAIAVLWSIDRLAESSVSSIFDLAALPPLAPSYQIVPTEAARVIWAVVMFATGGFAWWLSGRLDRREHNLSAMPESANRPAENVTIAGLVHCTLAYSMMALVIVQGFAFAETQFNGPQTWTFPVPFKGNDAFTAPAGAFRPPSASAVRLVGERLETDQYRSAAVMEPGGFPLYGPAGGLEYASHLAEFWQLRLIQGYPGIERRFASLPWQGAANTRSLYFAAGAPLPWELLALLNVKYAVTVNPALYYNFGGGDPASGTEAGLADLQVVENPFPVAARQFFARSVRPISAGDVSSLLPRDPAAESLVEGLASGATFPTEGRIDARYASDTIDIHVDPTGQARFLVLNEAYDARWKATANGQDLPIFATNIVMRGLIVPPDIADVRLRFDPSWPSHSLGLLQASAAVGMRP